MVQPTSPTEAKLVLAVNVTTVKEVSAGVYCLTPAATGINPATDTAAVSAEVSYSAAKAVGLVAVNQQREHCPSPATSFEVDTYAPAGGGTATGYAFTIIIP